MNLKRLKSWKGWLPTYGKWGGIGFSGGTFPTSPAETDWTVASEDSMDEVFKEHDCRYQAAIMECRDDREQLHSKWYQADIQLLEDLEEIPISPKNWIRQPKNSMLYAWFFRKFSIGIFGLKVYLQ